MTGGVIIGLAECNGGSNAEQVWLPLEYTIILANDQPETSGGYCLDVYTNDQAVGTLVDDARCNTTSAQWFTFRPAPSGDNDGIYYAAELWSQNSDGSNSYMVDGDSNTECDGQACLFSTSESVSYTSQLFNFQGPGIDNDVGYYTYQMGNGYQSNSLGGDANYCEVYEADYEGILYEFPSTCYAGGDEAQQWFISLVASGFPSTGQGGS